MFRRSRSAITLTASHHPYQCISPNKSRQDHEYLVSVGAANQGAALVSQTVDVKIIGAVTIRIRFVLSTLPDHVKKGRREEEDEK